MVNVRVRDMPELTTVTSAAKLYADSGTADTYVTANRLASYARYDIDIRDYGTVTDGGNIGPALQAALTANVGVVTCPRIRIPKVGSGTYTCSAITFPTGGACILIIDCSQITTSNTWTIPSGYTVIGTLFRSANLPIPYGPWQATRIVAGNGISPVVKLNGQNIWIENFEVVTSGTGGTCVYCDQTELYTLRRMVMFSGGNYPDGPLVCTNTFWGQFDNIFCQPDTTGQYAITFATDVNVAKNNGIMVVKDVIITRNGVLFRSVYGPSGVDNTQINRIHAESLLNGNSLINFDSTTNGIGGIEIINPEFSDSITNAYLIKNTGSNTSGVTIRGFNRGDNPGNGAPLFDPTSTPIKNLHIDWFVTDVATAALQTSLAKTYGGNGQINYKQVTCESIDAKLLSAPVGVPWTIYTPLPIEQNPSNWTPQGGAVITAGLPGPDGTLMAGRVSGGSGAWAYQANVTYAAGDWIIVGCWIRDPNGNTIRPENSANTSGLEILGGGGSPIFVYNGGNGGGQLTGDFLFENYGDNGWQWCCNGSKITSLGSFTNPGDTRYRLMPDGTHDKEFFGPCAMIIPSSAGFDDAHIVNWIRSIKGGWSSNSARGDVGLLDHQVLKAGTFKATGKTFATLSTAPVAGMMAYVSDASTNTLGSTFAGGSTFKVAAFYNGSNWTVMGK